MGAFSSSLARRNGGVEVVDIQSPNAYRYPPKSGNYFGSHFIMGGERFDMSQPEAYLFGENSDLNFLGCKPIPFPYAPATGNEPTKTLKSLVNIRKDSLRLVRIPEAEKLKPDEPDETVSNKYNLEFTFDSDVKCSIKIMYCCTEEINNGQINYTPKHGHMTSDTYHYKRGAGQVFQQSSHILDPTVFEDDVWQYNPDREDIPVVIQCIAEDEDNSFHAHMTYCTVERSTVDSCYVVKPLKQKQFVHGLCYLLQEIYGIENKSTENAKDDDDGDDDLEDSGAECVICMSDMRDTLILPCRHLCLCSTCAESLRYQASSCPICRSPFRALLQIRAMRRKPAIAVQQGDQTTEDNTVGQEGVPPGYEAVSLIEALNGPCGLPPPNTMEGIHVPPPNRCPPTETESHQKRRSGKKHVMPVEVVKELMMSSDDKKIPEEKDGDRTDTSVKTDSSVPLSGVTTTHKSRAGNGRHRKMAAAGDTSSMTQSPSSDQDGLERVQMVNEIKMTPKKGGVAQIEVTSNDELTVKYPPLTVSSENLADDEREDTSEGEVEPEPDYELEECCAIRSSDIDDDLSIEEESNTIGSCNYPPDYDTVMNEQETGTIDQDEDVEDDEETSVPVELHLSTTDSGGSNHSSHALLS